MPTERKLRSSLRKRDLEDTELYFNNDDISQLLKDLDDDDDHDENDGIIIKKNFKSSKKQEKNLNNKNNKYKRKPTNSCESDTETSSNFGSSESTIDIQTTPPKQRKQNNNTSGSVTTPTTPSSLLNRLSLKDNNDNSKCKKKIIIDNNVHSQIKKYQSAKISLACTETKHLPGRENEIKQLQDFLFNHLKNLKSGSLYVSGQPGTGKTACLSNILQDEIFTNKCIKVYINCTSISSIGSIYKKICSELKLNPKGKTEKDHLGAVEKYIAGNHKMIVLVLDEIDQLVGKKQSVLYTIFEWPSKPLSKIIIIGIANSLDLTDRLLQRLNTKCYLKPTLLHFPPYSKEQIINIFKSRLESAGVIDIFSPATVQLLAAKVAAISGDVRKALDIGRRVIEIAEQQDGNGNINANLLEFNIDEPKPVGFDSNIIKPIEIKQVANVLNDIYGASQKLNEQLEDSFPLQQKILICTLMLMLKKGKNKDITIGKLHEVYKKVCQKRNILAVDQTEFVSICSLVETRGILRIMTKKEPRLSKIFLQWDDEEVNSALKDKQLISTILEDDSCLKK